jgi:hypothetical protein
VKSPLVVIVVHCHGIEYYYVVSQSEQLLNGPSPREEAKKGYASYILIGSQN